MLLRIPGMPLHSLYNAELRAFRIHLHRPRKLFYNIVPDLSHLNSW